SLSINIHIIDKERRKYSAHFMMWLNSYPAPIPCHSTKLLLAHRGCEMATEGFRRLALRLLEIFS
ncbi:hypothetical protein, partial [Geobacillus stearothermophilus]|uniref:hypothetical protein n=1 Tax=Geobacillus stearothermophilus TaxID=1422 RepID=UPI001E4B3B75